MDWWEIVCSIAVPALGIIAAMWKGWAKAKRWARLGAVVGTEAAQVLVAFADAIEDDRLTREELKTIAGEVGDIIDIFRGDEDIEDNGGEQI